MLGMLDGVGRAGPFRPEARGDDGRGLCRSPAEIEDPSVWEDSELFVPKILRVLSAVSPEVMLSLFVLSPRSPKSRGSSDPLNGTRSSSHEAVVHGSGSQDCSACSSDVAEVCGSRGDCAREAVDPVLLFSTIVRLFADVIEFEVADVDAFEGAVCDLVLLERIPCTFPTRDSV